jgi:hypothetical protein
VPVGRLRESSVQQQVLELQIQGDSPQAECFAYIERDFVSASQPNLH